VGNFSLDDALSLPVPEDAGQAASPAVSENKTGPEDRTAAENGTGPGTEEFESLRQALMPLRPELFSRLGIPCLDIGEKEAAAVSHGGSLRFLERRAPEGQETPGLTTPIPAALKSSAPGSVPLALFHRGSLVALAEKKNGLWSYGYVASV
jgi:hypothetical protein